MTPHAKEIVVLLVGDDVSHIDHLFASMQHTYSIDQVSTPARALERLLKYNYDIVISEDSWTLLGVPGVMSSGVAVISLLPDDDPALALGLLEAGAADTITPEDLTPSRLESLMQRARARAQVQRNLLAQEERYRDIVEFQSEYVIRYDTDYHLTFVNRAYSEYRGQSVESLLGTGALVTVHPADQPSLRYTIDTLLKGIGTVTTDVEVAPGRHDDKETWHHWTTRAIYDAEGGVVEYQSVIRDVTERKGVEEALNSRLQDLSVLRRVDVELTETLNIDSVVTLALDSAMRLSGADIAGLGLYNPQSERLELNQVYGVPKNSPLKRTFSASDGVIGDVIVSHEPMFIEDMSANPDCTPTEPDMTAQMIIPLLSRERFLGLISLETRVEGRFTPAVFDFLQLVTARIAVALDNARLYDLQRIQLDELRQVYEQVSQLEQLKTQMIRLASHDLRNPIGVLQGYIEMVLWDVEADPVDRERVRNQLDVMDKMVRRMRKITQDILSVERIEQQGGLENAESIDLAKALRDAADDYEPFASTKGLAYDVDIPQASVYLVGDDAQLREAATNLIANAVKYTPSGGEINVRMEYDGDAAVFEVIDNGFGIPKSLQSRLFEPFFRAKTRANANIEGTGLGLHLVKSIVERHGGRIIFRSTEGEGSTFGFQIPTNGAKPHD